MKMIQSIPALPVININKAIEFYKAKLGFSASYYDDSFARLSRSGAEIHLWAAYDEKWKSRESLLSHPIVSGAESFLAGTASCRIQVQGIEELYGEYKKAGVLYSPGTTITNEPWGERDFPVLDLHRNLLTFYEVMG